MAHFPLIFFGVLLNAVAQICLKVGAKAMGYVEFGWATIIPVGWKIAKNPYVILGVSCYMLSLILWVLVLSQVAMSTAYPLLSLGYIVTALAGYVLFGEPLTVSKISGIFIIIIGAYLVAQN